MSTKPLTEGEKQILLRVARQAMACAVQGKPRPAIEAGSLTPRLLELGACFVTLTIEGDLRGCIGALEAYQPLVEDVQEHAVSAALEDPRFPPVSTEELPAIRVEISRLTAPVALEYTTPEDLMEKLRPGRDGVVLKSGFRRATFLPQVWEKIPKPADFLNHLCVKMGASADLWRRSKMQVQIYQVEEFEES